MASIYEISKDLGMVTAYAYAVSKGYTGTEEEFATLMASYANVGQQAVDAALEAQGYANAASQSATDANAAKTIAVSAKDIAVDAKNTAVSSKDTALNAAAAANTSKMNAAASASDAEQSAQIATNKANAASASAATATNAATTATEMADNASGSASDAEQSAIDALASKNAAEASETNAAASATGAAGSEAAAKASENAAKTSETNAAASATNAAGSASQAAQSVTDANASKIAAATSEGNASQSATDAAGSATAAAGSAQAAQDVLDSIPEDYTALVERVDDLDERKANIDGYYQQMTVGDAEQLVATVGVHDDDPYLFRTAGGSADIGNRATIEHLEGVTIGWNQQVVAGNFAELYWGVNNGSLVRENNIGKYTITTITNSSNQNRIATPDFPLRIVKDHKMLLGFDFFSTREVTCNITSYSVDVSATIIPMRLVSGNANRWTNFATIYNSTATGGGDVRIGVNTQPEYNMAVGDEVWFRNVVAFDLTQMFGTTIADYIYSLEQANAGAGVVFFHSIFPKPYYEYNPGQLMSVQAAMHITRGFNAWDEEWEVGNISATGENETNTMMIRSKNYVPVIENMAYYLTNSGISTGSLATMFYYDADRNFISSAAVVAASPAFTTPSGARYLRFVMVYTYGTTYKNDICINLSWDGERDGEYEPYKANEYTLGEVELRGIPKLENGKLVYDGDTYAPDGTVTRKYGVVDLGSLTWVYNTSGASDGTMRSTFAVKGMANNLPGNLMCQMYETVALNDQAVTVENRKDKTIATVSNGTFIQVRNSAYTDAATFKSAMSGVYLVYELATPTTETADPWSNPQEVDDFGTEEFVEFSDRDVHIPVGHSTLYQANLRAKLEMAPNSPDGDGDYVVRQTAGQNEYVPLTEATAEAMARKADIDGNYPDMTVGNAEQLVSTVGVDDNAPYNYRTSGGSADIGDRETLNAVVGGSLAWNQLVRDEASANTTDFADIVSVSDAVADEAGVAVKFEPVQDLHGYDHPWPAGGGENKWPVPNMSFSNYSTGLSRAEYPEIYAAMEKLTPGAIYRCGSTGTDENVLTAINLYYSDRTIAIRPTNMTGGDIPDLSDGTITLNTVQMQVGTAINVSKECHEIRVVETTTSDPAYSPYANICPITGFTGANVIRTGKNLLKTSGLSYVPPSSTIFGVNTKRTFADNSYCNGITYNNACQVGRATGIAVSENSIQFTTDAQAYGVNIPVVGLKAGRAYTVSATITNGLIGVGFYEQDGTYISGEANVNSFTVPDRTYYVLLAFQAATGNEQSVFTDIQLELGDTATEYAPYSGATLPVSWETEAGTVYGGELTVNEDGTGSLVVTSRYEDVKANANIYYLYDGLDGKYAAINVGSAYRCALKASEMHLAKNQEKFTHGYIDNPYTIGADNVAWAFDNTIRLPNFGCETREEWVAYVQSQDALGIVYPLLTPVTYALTAAEITTLLGENHVWSDVGQVSLTYTGTHEFLTLQNGRKYLSRIDGTDAMVAGTGQTLEAVKGTDNVFDLTQMFGSAVADVAYGQGAAWFRKYFPKPKYLYNAGEIMNVQTSGHKMVGFNLFDEVWETGGYQNTTGEKVPNSSCIRSKNYIRVIPDSTYYFSFNSSSAVVLAYDENKHFMRVLTAKTASGTFVTSPGRVHYVTFYMIGTTYNHDVCINLSWDGERNGEYEPYEERTYPLDPIELRGIPKLDSSNNLYYDGDRYLPDGTVERRYGVLTLTGNETYNVSADSYIRDDACDAWYAPDLFTGMISSSDVARCNKLAKSNDSTWAGKGHVNEFTLNSNQVHVSIDNKLTGIEDISTETRSSVASKIASYIKSLYDSGDPLMIIYPLATPTTETAETYQETQIVDDFGTEEFIDERDIPVPVGHETTYQPNLRAKLEMVPDSPSDDGDYIVRHVNGQNEYIALPAIPSANGAYVLKVTVSNGTPTLTWEAST